MSHTFAANLAEYTTEEEKAITIYTGLIAAKMKEDLYYTKTTLEEDQKCLAELQKGCATKTAEWEERSKTRAEELMALADTIKVLNDDDALDLFRKTLPGSSFVQMKYTARATQSSALATIRSALRSANKSDRPGLELLALALAGKKSLSTGSFDKVVTMIDYMVEHLLKEQHDDDHKKEYCALQLDATGDKKKVLHHVIEQKANVIETLTETIVTVTEEIATLTIGIKTLDKSVAEATEQRKEENAEFKALVASNTAAIEVLSFAKNRLNKFYNPKLYNPPAERYLSSEDTIYENMGNAGGLLTTPSPGGIADTGITALVEISQHSLRKVAPPPPPSTWGVYVGASKSGNGVCALIEFLIKDLKKEITEATTDEKNSQADYEALMIDSAAKRVTYTRSLTVKTTSKADMESEKQTRVEEKGAGIEEFIALEKYYGCLHGECDWLLQYFDVRKQARADEVDSLKRAKAVLSGTDYSLIQLRGQRFLSRAQ